MMVSLPSPFKSSYFAAINSPLGTNAVVVLLAPDVFVSVFSTSNKRA